MKTKLKKSKQKIQKQKKNQTHYSIQNLKQNFGEK